FKEWNHDSSLDWHLTGQPLHRGMQSWVEQLNRLYRQQPAMHELEMQPGGFEWVDCNDSAQSTLSMLRLGSRPGDTVLIVCNFTPVIRDAYEVGVPSGGFWRELLNSDAKEYGGSGVGNMGGRTAEERPVHGRPFSLRLVLPPLSALFLKLDAEPK
ncbi:MAG: alpha amylase C-terminal domain-containing protein, partial [Acidobacteriales bacterium]|nr:alpha amylase C-terminal domain-containing protein [Terriglobales bacterium]